MGTFRVSGTVTSSELSSAWLVIDLGVGVWLLPGTSDSAIVLGISIVLSSFVGASTSETFISKSFLDLSWPACLLQVWSFTWTRYITDHTFSTMVPGSHLGCPRLIRFFTNTASSNSKTLELAFLSLFCFAVAWF